MGRWLLTVLLHEIIRVVESVMDKHGHIILQVHAIVKCRLSLGFGLR